jgi:nucleoid-associated protein YgaU
MLDRKKQDEEIVKRIRNPREDEKEEVQVDTNHEENKYEYYKQQEKKEENKNVLKKVSLTLFGLTTLGAIGYLGFNYAQTETTKQPLTNPNPLKIENNQTQKITTSAPVVALLNTKPTSNIEQTPIAKETEEKVIPKEQPKVEAQTTEITPIVAPKPIEKKVEVAATQKVEIKPVVALKKEKPKPKPKIIPKKETTSVVTIKKGDTLASIAKKFYGDHKEFKRIVSANPSIKNERSSLKVGQKVIIPRMKSETKKSQTKKKETKRKFVTVKKGDTLATISKKFYGKTTEVQKIVNANNNIKNKNSTLHLGQKIYLPE